jgi:hypothetical protein
MFSTEKQKNECIESFGPPLIEEQWKDHNYLITTAPRPISKGFMAPNNYIRSHHLGIGKPNTACKERSRHLALNENRNSNYICKK